MMYICEKNNILGKVQEDLSYLKDIAHSYMGKLVRVLFFLKLNYKVNVRWE